MEAQEFSTTAKRPRRGNTCGEKGTKEKRRKEYKVALPGGEYAVAGVRKEDRCMSEMSGSHQRKCKEGERKLGWKTGRLTGGEWKENEYASINEERRGGRPRRH